MEGFRLQRPTRRDDVRPVPAKHGWSVQGLRSHMDFVRRRLPSNFAFANTSENQTKTSVDGVVGLPSRRHMHGTGALLRTWSLARATRSKASSTIRGTSAISTVACK